MNIILYGPPRPGAPMPAVNPLVVLRNFLAQQPIDRAEQGQHKGFPDLLEGVRRPQELQPAREAFDVFRPARARAGRSMLSCNS